MFTPYGHIFFKSGDTISTATLPQEVTINTLKLVDSDPLIRELLDNNGVVKTTKSGTPLTAKSTIRGVGVAIKHASIVNQTTPIGIWILNENIKLDSNITITFYGNCTVAYGIVV